jgi:hypothetical protein
MKKEACTCGALIVWRKKGPGYHASRYCYETRDVLIYTHRGMVKRVAYVPHVCNGRSAVDGKRLIQAARILLGVRATEADVLSCASELGRIAERG